MHFHVSVYKSPDASPARQKFFSTLVRKLSRALLKRLLDPSHREIRFFCQLAGSKIMCLGLIHETLLRQSSGDALEDIPRVAHAALQSFRTVSGLVSGRGCGRGGGCVEYKVSMALINLPAHRSVLAGWGFYNPDHLLVFCVILFVVAVLMF